MGHIPSDAEWYIGELIMEITVAGAISNVVHKNLTLIRANSPDEAYDKAIRFGHGSETSYENPHGQIVKITFRGVAKLDVSLEDLYDGAELKFEEKIDVSDEEIMRWIPAKESLEVFVPPNPGRVRDPDYRSRVVIEMAADLTDKEKN